ncbi:MAG: heavy metal translocating P-type ATPase [Gemmatimonadota bacterium]
MGEVTSPVLGERDFEVTGMTCAACVRRVERQVAKLPGVAEVAVNLATEGMRVRFDAARLDEAQIVAAVDRAGYGARARETGPVAAGGAVPEGDHGVVDRRARQREEIQAQRRSLRAALAFWLPIFLLEMGDMAGLPWPAALSFQRHPFALGLVQLLLVLPVAWIGRRIYADGLRTLAHGGPNMFTLIALGTAAAFGFSAWGLASVALGQAESFDTYFPAASTIVALMLLGRYLEALSRNRAGEAMHALMDLQPRTAARVEDGAERAVPIGEVEAGDLLRVRPGEAIPTDGEVVEGRSAVDESMLTGESMPVAREPGDRVIGGSLNRQGLLLVRATRVGRDTVLAQIVRLVEQAQEGKAPIARLADVVAGYFVPAVMVIAVAAAAAWLLSGASAAFALRVFVAVLIIACPCSLGLATPAAIMVGTGRGAQLGILVKSPEALEETQRLDTLVLDKTGTITRGEPAVTAVRTLGSWTEAEVLAQAASVEQGSEHPLAQAIVAQARARGLELNAPTGFEAVPGHGARARLGDRMVAVGSRRMMAELGVALDAALSAELEEAGQTPVWVAADGHLAGLIGLADVPRDSSAEDIRQLRAQGLSVVMVTGDSRRAAEAIARQVGVTEVRAEVLPEDKAAIVRSLQAQGRRVGMVGDGVNDAPALAQANVGIAIAAGADVALESADLVLMNSRLGDVSRALRLSRAVMRTIRQNLFWAFFYNAVGIPVAAGALHLFGGPLLNPMLASLAMAFSSVSVIANALRLKRFERG